MTTTDIATTTQHAVAAAPIDGWKLAVRKAEAYAQSTMVPQQYQGNVPNCIIAMEMADRMGASPMMVMQNLFIVHGNPGWSAKFLIASFNQCGRFSAMRYEWSQDRTRCRAWAVEKATGDRIDGPEVSVEMAKAEGWSTKNGSKWKTMPELMLMYRAAAFLVRTHAPEISMGLQTQEELIDVESRVVPQEQRQASPAEVSQLLGVSAPAASIEPADEQPSGQALADYVAAVEGATGAEAAGLLLDEARDVLQPGELAELQKAYRMAWEG